MVHVSVSCCTTLHYKGGRYNLTIVYSVTTLDILISWHDANILGACICVSRTDWQTDSNTDRNTDRNTDTWSRDRNSTIYYFL